MDAGPGSPAGERLSAKITANHLYAITATRRFDRLEPTGMVEVLDLSQWRNGAWEEIPQPIPWNVEANWGGACTEGRAGGEVWSVGGAAAEQRRLAALNLRFDDPDAEEMAEFYERQLEEVSAQTRELRQRLTEA
jgi:hypothetical protein